MFSNCFISRYSRERASQSLPINYPKVRKTVRTNLGRERRGLPGARVGGSGMAAHRGPGRDRAEPRGRRRVRGLVERFDTELFSDFSAKSSNFRRLVLSCINADFCVQILILQRFSKSTRLSHLCTARNSKSSQIFVKLFHIFAEISAKIAIFQQFSSNFASISMKFSQNFDE